MTHAEFIEGLGKTGEIASLLGVDSQLVSKWRKRNIPWRWRRAFVLLAANKGVQLPDGFLGE